VQPFVTPPLATALNPHIGHKVERRYVMGPTVAEDLVVWQFSQTAEKGKPREELTTADENRRRGGPAGLH